MVGRLRRDRSRWSPPAALVLFVVVVLLSLPGVAAQTATPVASPAAGAGAPLPPAWLEFGPMGHLLARVIVEWDCPPLILDGLAVAMSPRAAVSDDFPVVACEATVPFGAGSASIQGQVLPLPVGPLTRTAVIGDSGCWHSDWDKAYQACNDPAAWPFAAVAASVAAWDPDLIVHVGDYVYRESPCPAGEAGCAGSPHGDNWATWDADFFYAGGLVAWRGAVALPARQP